MNFKNVLYRLLGHLYAAESLILLNRAGEAIPHLNPDNISQISNFPPSDNQKPALAAHGALRGVAWLGVALSCLALPCLALRSTPLSFFFPDCCYLSYLTCFLSHFARLVPQHDADRQSCSAVQPQRSLRSQRRI